MHKTESASNGVERTIIRDLPKSIGKQVEIRGWVSVRRDHGKLIFLDIRDRSGEVQVVVTPKESAALETAKQLRAQWVVCIEGTVKERPENMRTDTLCGMLEVSALNIEVLSAAHELPFELDAEVNIDTHFDYLPLTLRTEKSRDIFTLQATIVEAYRASLRAMEFTEFQAPSLVGGDAEGGAAAFKVDYYYDTTAFLATSPQFYKQIMVGPFERAFTVAKVFRGEKHATTRHLSELTCVDFEMGFIKDHRDPMGVLERAIHDVVQTVKENHPDIFARFKVDVPLIPSSIPILKLREAHKILGVPEMPDMEPEHERQICEWAKKEHKSDFVFITDFPTASRAFYTYEDPADAPYSRSFDLLFRGLEINSGSQRIHDHAMLVERMRSRGLDPEKYSFYLQAFKYGLPPHGGSSTGVERITARMLELPNVKEASAFPRDLNRIDVRLSL
ncbi:aspartate--tRNA(Asn) ligase [Candidatus Kaiserbacteria bacterium RIFCSPHIGHO2_12_FULL_53_13]|uniref:Aspartate--tRNA(Asn) ligase n=1 Tax=Candidatus Kaiserbacteria bacterium RIFCSPHIGHO2_12_FULL_53_13 TaxID=1798502 RepID=A0A1F6E8V0_9BACT|nr:MAG: aspartate--tRNA(Asn) ligase [Candidatus Kaiserbacteria bacterium RIFCSPHIGHO2_12_FULL_53_13]OGG74426.1 MAG: aspartate--tRNA(Asn) ligase [Candidatus Kaiserbacteria bacterium RIFCSPLOWO2_01_FULL_52_36]